MYILQESLFSFEELQKMESKERLPIFFGTLDLRPYAKELKFNILRSSQLIKRAIKFVDSVQITSK
ncbi:hypothetical protein SAMN04487895_102394 [Paenibacillus sophorae]|uniref:Uncharacterized protein n=1 Tax=Paenibacillus sophorae TaxID=1333845 RepID=A0A1H8J0V8_9BACL|nr:hypothetical protein SAMN04487895_102394 [Paenibacillus sophorae]